MKNTRTALLLFLALFGSLIVLYILLRVPANLPVSLAAMVFALAIIGIYAANLIFIGRLLAENKAAGDNERNRIPMRIAILTMIFPLISLVLYYLTF